MWSLVNQWFAIAVRPHRLVGLVRRSSFSVPLERIPGKYEAQSAWYEPVVPRFRKPRTDGAEDYESAE